MFTLADELLSAINSEQKAFSNCNAILATYDRNKPFHQQDTTFKTSFWASYREIKHCENEQIEICKKYFLLDKDERKEFWQCYTENQNDQQIYDDFVKYIDASPLNQEQKNLIQTDLMRLLIYPAGRKLVSKTLQALTNYEKVNDIDSPLIFEIGQRPVALNEFSTHLMEQSPASKKKINAYSPEHSLKDFENLKLLYKDRDNIKHPYTNIGVLTIVLNNTDAINIAAGISSTKDTNAVLFASPRHQSLYHELAHTNRDIRGASKCQFTIPFFLKGMFVTENAPEELWTIHLANLSDNVLQVQRNSPLRITHNGFQIYPNQEETVGELQSDHITSALLNVDYFFGRRNFDNLAFRDNHFVYLKLYDLKGMLSISHSQLMLLLIQCSIENGCFSNSEFVSFGTKNCELISANFDNSKLRKSIFRDSTLKDCSFKFADMEGVQFINCDLQGCDFTDTNLKNMKFIGEIKNIESCLFSDTTLTGFVPEALLDAAQCNIISMATAVRLTIEKNNLVSNIKNNTNIDIELQIEALFNNSDFVNTFLISSVSMKTLESFLINDPIINLIILNLPITREFIALNKFNEIENYMVGMNKDNANKYLELLTLLYQEQKLKKSIKGGILSLSQITDLISNAGIAATLKLIHRIKTKDINHDTVTNLPPLLNEIATTQINKSRGI